MASEYISKIIDANDVRNGNAVSNDQILTRGEEGAIGEVYNDRVVYESDSIKGRYGSDNGDIDDIRIDSVTNSLQGVDYPHHEIHVGGAYSVHHYELDFDKASEIGILFTTPNTTKWIHCFPMVAVATKALFEILEDPVVYTDAYPTVFYAPRNRNRNFAIASTVSSVRASPSTGQVSLKEEGDTIPATSGTVVHAEAFGGTKNQTVTSGTRDTNEYVLKQNTTYYFRLRGNNTGADSVSASIELSWYEHTNQH